jgi:hypothetical protein
VDFARLSFDDNTMAPAQQALADGELSVFDTYDTEPASGARDAPTDAPTGTALLRAVGDGEGWCVFATDVRNTYGLPFQVMFEQHQEGEGALSSIPYSA